MVSLEKFKQLIGTEALNYSDEELEDLHRSFYDLGQLMFDVWHDSKNVSKDPVGEFSIGKNLDTI
jgi:hypothetical protein